MNFAHYDPVGFIVLALVFALVVLYWVLYTRRLRTPRNAGKQEGIALATQAKERHAKADSIS